MQVRALLSSCTYAAWCPATYHTQKCANHDKFTPGIYRHPLCTGRLCHTHQWPPASRTTLVTAFDLWVQRYRTWCLHGAVSLTWIIHISASIRRSLLEHTAIITAPWLPLAGSTPWSVCVQQQVMWRTWPHGHGQGGWQPWPRWEALQQVWLDAIVQFNHSIYQHTHYGVDKVLQALDKLDSAHILT